MFRVFAPAVRRNTLLAAAVSLAPLLGGCVSAVDESTAFGFTGSTPPTDAMTASIDPLSQSAPGPDEATPASAGDALASEGEPAPVAALATDAAASTDAPAPETVAQDAAGEAVAGPSIAEAGTDPDAAIAAGRATVAAYAGATVAPSSATLQPGAADERSGRKPTLFTSLFAESKAKTPVRNAESGKSRRVLLKPEGAPVPVGETALAALPGVKSRASLFEIGQRASADYDAEILEEANAEEGSYQVASLTGMARLAPNGLMVQRPGVETGCFEPKLVGILRAVEARFNTKVVVTSGYRSPSYNKRVNGARRSMHMGCKAADVQVPGANKLDVANFVRSLPGRGGVGTYCHTTAIHVDIGRERDWNWACRRRRS